MKQLNNNNNMNMKTIKLNSFWEYIGPRPGCGERHKVISVNPDEVISTSLKCSFLGSPNDFIKNFSWLYDPLEK